MNCVTFIKEVILIFRIAHVYDPYIRITSIGSKNAHSFYVYTKCDSYSIRRVSPHFCLVFFIFNLAMLFSVRTVISHRSNRLKKHMKRL
jgi:hypothetical protein